MAIDPVALAGIVSGGGAIGWMIYKDRIERRKTKESGLADNPERCAAHEVRIGQIEEHLQRVEDQNREDHADLTRKVGDIAIQVGNICGKLNGMSK